MRQGVLGMRIVMVSGTSTGRDVRGAEQNLFGGGTCCGFKGLLDSRKGEGRGRTVVLQQLRSKDSGKWVKCGAVYSFDFAKIFRTKT